MGQGRSAAQIAENFDLSERAVQNAHQYACRRSEPGTQQEEKT